MSKEWVVTFSARNGQAPPQEAHYATEEEARAVFRQVIAVDDGARACFTDMRKIEFAIVASDYHIMLFPPEHREGMLAAARAAQGQNQSGIVTGARGATH